MHVRLHSNLFQFLLENLQISEQGVILEDQNSRLKICEERGSRSQPEHNAEDDDVLREKLRAKQDHVGPFFLSL
jgi:hypothetical protein